MTDWTPPIRLYNEVSAATLNTYWRDNIKFLAENLPHEAHLWHGTSLVLAGNPIAKNTQPSQWFRRTWSQSTSADGDQFSQSFCCARGTGTLTILCRKTSTSGLVDWALDGVSITTGMDFYDGAGAVNQLLTIDAVDISTPGRHVLTGTVNGKNGSSGGYDVEITQIWLTVVPTILTPPLETNLVQWHIPHTTTLYQDSGETTAVAADGDPVGAWVDSMLGDDIVQATALARPTYRASVAAFNNEPALQFDGGDYLQGSFASALTQPTTIFVALKWDGAGTENLVDGDDASNRNTLYTASGKFYYYAGAIKAGPTADANANIHCVVINGASSDYYLNGTSSGTQDPGANVLDGLTLGARYDGAAPLTGYVGEVLIYNAALSAADKNTVQNYLASKFNISVTAFT